MKNASKDATKKSLRWGLALAAAVAALSAGAWLLVRGAGKVVETLGADGPAALACEPGDEFSASFTLRVHTELKLDATALIGDPRTRGRMLASEAGFASRLRVRSVRQRKDGAVLAMQLDQIAPSSSALEVSRELGAELARPFFVVLGKDCRIAETGFAPDLSAEAVNRLQAIVHGLSLAFAGSSGKSAWTSREYDSVGQYAARYERAVASGEVVKKRTGYLDVHPQPGSRLKETLLVRILRSNTTAALDEEGAWLARLEADDHHQITRTNASLVADVKTSLSIEMRADEEPLAALLPADLRWRSDREAPLQAEARRPDPPDYMKGIGLDEALARFAELLRAGGPGGGAQAADFLSLVLRAQPGLAFEIMGLLQQGELPIDLESTAFLALELSGTPEAHEALIQGLSNDHAPRNRVRAAAALPDIPRPSAKTLAALASTAREAVAETKDETQLVRNAAVYALGALEQRTRSKDPALAKQAVAELRAQLDKVQKPNELAAALDAVGNSGNAAFIHDLKPHLAAKDPLVRTHAIEAMAHMDPDASKAAFRTLMEGEADARIRGTIARTYADQARHADSTAPREVVQGALDVLVREPDPRVRGLLIDLVGPAAASDPSAMQALAEQFKRESDPNLLRQIGRYVPADRLGS